MVFISEAGCGLSFIEPIDACVVERFRFRVFELNPLCGPSIRMKAKAWYAVVGRGSRFDAIDQCRGVRSWNRRSHTGAAPRFGERPDVGSIGESIPLGGQVGDQLRVIFGDVVGLAAVVGQVVELPDDWIAAIIVSDQLPWSTTNRSMRLVLPKDRTFLHLSVWLSEVRQHAGAFEREA